MDTDYENLIHLIDRLNDLPDDHVSKALDSSQRQELRKKLRKLNLILENSGEIVDRILHSPADVVAIRIAVQLNLFHILIESENPRTCQELAELTGADETLLARILRYLAGIEAIDNAGPYHYTATRVSRAFATTKGISGSGLFVQAMIPAWLQLPKVLADSAYRNPIDPLRCGIQPAHNTTDHLFKWLPKNPSILKDFNLYMTSLRVGHAHWLDFYPFQEQVYKGIPDPLEEQIVFVDVGGAVGHEILEIRKRNPGLVGRMVLQDLPKTLEQVTAGPAMLETMSHDFFTPQPCQGAQAYYFRNVLHNWPDDECRIILQQTCVAMKENYSKILINEMVVPMHGGDLFAMQTDINMMSIVAGIERTEEQWHQLLGSVGLRIVRIWTEEPDSESIIEAMLA